MHLVSVRETLISDRTDLTDEVEAGGKDALAHTVGLVHELVVGGKFSSPTSIFYKQISVITMFRGVIDLTVIVR